MTLVESQLDDGGCDAVTSDGGTVHIRPITPADGDRLRAFHSRLSPESIYLRFFTPHPRLSDAEVEHFTTVDMYDRVALVVTVGDDIIAVGRYERLAGDATEAEVAFVVADEHHGRGIATLLLEHLADYARTNGIAVLTAQTLWENRAMLSVFRQAGFTETTSHDSGVVEVRMDIVQCPGYEHAVLRREMTSTASSVRRILEPRSVAIVGASSKDHTIGHALVHNVLDGFEGEVYPVNPHEDVVDGRPAYRSVSDITGPVDVAVISVPRDCVPTVAIECARKGVKGLIVISAGFAETDDRGRQLQRELLATARSSGMRLLGPNCMGVLRHGPDGTFDATFSPVRPPRGRIGFASQSGGLGIAIMNEAATRRVGVSTFVSMGNKADLSGNDLLSFWGGDAETDVILLYLESIGNPRRFSRIAQQVSRTKPIIAVKGGRSEAGQRAASSHTAAMASSETAVNALFAQTGVIRVDDLGDLFDTALVMSTQPAIAGSRVAIVTNAGGPAILAADACVASGLEVAPLGDATRSTLAGFLPPWASTVNPVDMIASATGDDYTHAIRVVLEDPNVDGVIAIFVPPLVTTTADVARALLASRADATRLGKPLLPVFVGAPEPPTELVDEGLPVFSFPEPAAKALSRLFGYGAWRARGERPEVHADTVDTAAARATLTAVLAEDPDGRWLRPSEANALLTTYGIPVVPTTDVHSADEAARALATMGGPVALKAVGPSLVHKSERGAVRLDLRAPADAAAAFTELERTLGADMQGAIVQPMAPPGVEVIVGAVADPAFGPLLMVGVGGTTVELFADSAWRALPLGRGDADELVRSLKGSPLLFGYRSAPPTDVAALVGLIERVAQLADDLPEVAEIEVNPAIVTEHGVSVVDVRVRVQPTQPELAHRAPHL